VPEKILDEARQEREDEIVDNIHEYIPDSYGCCEDCNRVDPDNSDYGYCPDCDSHYSDDDIEDIKEKAKDECINDIIAQIESREIQDATLRRAVENYGRRPAKCLA
jgi:hypothetical protein